MIFHCLIPLKGVDLIFISFIDSRVLSSDKITLMSKRKRTSPRTLESQLRREKRLRGLSHGHFDPIRLVVDDSIICELQQRNCDRSCHWTISFLQLASSMSGLIAQRHAKRQFMGDIRPCSFSIESHTATSLTPPNTFCKTCSGDSDAKLKYASPETTGRIAGTPDSRADLYSLGLCLYELLTGYLPFSVGINGDWAYCHIAIPPEPLHQISDIPVMICDIVHKLLQKDPEDRYQSAYGLCFDLDRCMSVFKESHSIHMFALGCNDTFERFQLPSRLYGREIQQQQMLKAAAETARGVSQVVSVSGCSGSGKSALVQSLREERSCEGMFFCSGKFDQFKRGIPFSTLVEAFGQLIAQQLSRPQEDVERLRISLQSACGSSAQLLIEVLPQLVHIIGPQPKVDILGPVQSLKRFATVMLRFMGVFACESHPLMLFLDDVQWADDATLDLLREIVSSSMTHCMVILAFRDESVPSQLKDLLKMFRESHFSLTEINLSALNTESASLFVADALRRDVASPDVKALTALVLKKTAGNPFYLKEFIKGLVSEELVRFNLTTLSWTWDVSAIEGIDITDNVVDFMVSKLKKLDKPTLKLLKVASCVGNSFFASILVFILKIKESDVVDRLDSCVRRGILSLESMHAFGERAQQRKYAFQHDRIHQAAHSLLTIEELKEWHYKAGKTLIEHGTDDDLFDAVSGLNMRLLADENVESTLDPNELLEIMYLNLKAGRKARGATAFDSALKYYSTALDLFETLQCEDDAMLLELVIGKAECDCVTGNHNESLEGVHRAIEMSDDPLEKSQAYFLQVSIFQIQGNMNRGVETSFSAFKALGYSIPDTREKVQEAIATSIATVSAFLEDKGIDALFNLSPLEDKNVHGLMRLLQSSAAPIYMANPEVFPLVCLKLVTLSIENGICPVSCFGYGVYALFLVGLFEEYETAFKCLQQSIELLDRWGNSSLRGVLLHFLGDHVNPWVNRLDTSLPILEKAFSACEEVGEIIFASFVAFQHTWIQMEVADSLGLVRPLIEKYSAFALSNKCFNTHRIIDCTKRFIATLEGHDDFRGQGLELLVALEAEGYGSGVVFYHVMQQILFFQCDDFDTSLLHASKVDPFLSAATAMPIVSTFKFYRAMALLRKGETFDVSETLRYFERCSISCSANFEHKLNLLLGEVYRSKGETTKAMECYEKSVVGSQHIPQYHALALESACQFYAGLSIDSVGGALFTASKAALRKLGNVFRLEHFRSKYSFQLGGSAIEVNFETLLKASHAMSQHLELEKVCHALMDMVMKEAGARSGALFLLRGDDHWELYVNGSINEVPAVVTRKEVADSSNAPVSLLRYVLRTQSDFLAEDIRNHKEFSKDVYFIKRGIKSVLAIPLWSRGRLIALALLENELLTGAFTGERLAVTKLLVGQVGTSLENASLFSELELRVHQRTEQLRNVNGELVRSQEQLRHAQDVAQMGSFLCSSTGVLWSQQMYRIHENAKEPLFPLSKEYAEKFVCVLDRVDFNSQVLKLFQNKIKTETFFYRIECEGVFKALEMRVVVETGGDISGTIQDVSERFKALQDREKFVSLVENSSDLVCITSLNDEIMFINNAGVGMTGKSGDELLHSHFVFLLPEQFRKDHEMWLMHPEKQLECICAVLQGNRRIPVLRHSFAIRELHTNKVSALATICKDISAIKKVEEELIGAKEGALEASRLKSQFLANMSHEIRTPLSGVLGMTSFILDTNLSEEQREYASCIHRSAQALFTVINDILDFSKVEAGKLEIEQIAFKLTDLVSDLEKLLRGEIRRKGLLFSVNYAKDLHDVYKGDPHRIRQILMNLLGNSVKFTEKGFVRLDVSESRGFILFKVSDSGIGMDLSRQILFESFSQADSSTTRKYGGTGLGLAISKCLLDLLGGKVTVESTPGKGTSFLVSVPTQRASLDELRFTVEDSPIPNIAKKSKVSANELNKFTVLIVEDNTVNRKIAVKIVEKLGFHTISVSDGQEALNVLLKDKSIDIVLMDCQMPILDGYSATIEIRTTMGLSDLPIIALTANALKEDREKCLSVGMNDYLSKPIIMEELYRKILKWLGIEKVA